MTIFILLVLFQIKHFLADYPLQNRYMLGKFKEKGWVAPLAAHASVHFVFTLLILVWLIPFPAAISLAAYDAFTHFGIDRVKASPKLLGRYTPQQSMFWNTIGLDQMCHHLVHYSIIYIVISL